jgi:hypothetical protein
LCEAATFRPQRLEQQVLHRRLVGRSGDEFDDPACRHQTCIVVCEHGARRGQLRQSRHCGDVASQRVIAAPEVLNIVTQPAWGVIEQLAHGHRGADSRFGHGEVGDVAAHRCIQIHLALIDQSHHRRASECLCGGTDPENCVAVDR